MSVIKVDVSDEGMSAPVFTPLEPGVYDLEIINDLKVEPTINPDKETGTNYGKVVVEYAEVESRKRLRDIIALHPKMNWRKNQWALSAGFPGAEDGEIDLADGKGSIVHAVIAQETYTKQDNTEGLRNKITMKGYQS